jgi:predicted transcriptional regulator
MIVDRSKAAEQAIVLELLGAVEKGGVTQRRLSRDLGIAVGLVNAYMKRCVSKGYIKVTQVPPQRYAYYLTPKGFREKSRLVADYFMSSFDFFRRARGSCGTALAAAEAAGHRRLILFGISDLAEISLIVATELRVKIVAVVDETSTQSRFLGLPVKRSVGDVTGNVDGALVTSLSDPRGALELAQRSFSGDRIYMPRLLSDIIGAHVDDLRPTNGRAKT